MSRCHDNTKYNMMLYYQVRENTFVYKEKDVIR
jgi:hypothetical protein